jgi:small subunit ribosomal protein S16
MSMKLRLARHGTTNLPFYWLVASDSRCARDGKFKEKLGTYNPLLPHENPERIRLNKERINYWLSVGAKPSDRVVRLFGLSEIVWTDKSAARKKSTPGKPKAKKKQDAA